MKHETRRDFLKAAAAGVALGCTPRILRAAPKRTGLASGLEKRFLTAIRSGDSSVVSELLAGHPGLLETRDETGLSGYAVALLAGHRDVADQLRAAGYESDLHESALALDWERFDALVKTEGDRVVPKVNANHAIGGTAMYAAATGGAGSSIWHIYAACADPNRTPGGDRHASPLQKALRFPDLAVAEMTAATLLGNDTSANSQTKADDPPLHIAAARGSQELVEMLIRLGADVTARDRKGRTASQAAAASGHPAIESLIEKHDRIPRTCRTSRAAYDLNGKPYAPEDISDIPLVKRRAMVGQSHGNLSYVKQAVREEPRLVHSVATTSEKCVEACAHTGRLAVVNFLVEHGAPYSLPTAVVRGDQKTTVRLLDEDPDRVHERGAHDFALLWYPVIGGGHLELMKLLLDRGAKVEGQHFLGTTALHWACMRGPIEMVELLIEHGADVNRVGRKFRAEGETPLQAARSAGQTRIARLLVDRGAR